MMVNPPSLKLKIFFWIILGAFSTAFVEVPAGSGMFPFTTIWGIIFIVPLYLLHTVVLAYIVFNFGKARLYTLFAAGMLFGMYEAYVTKVLWTSFMAEGPPVVFGGIALVETLVLVLFAHPWLAFVIPLLFSESVLTKSRQILKGLPERVKGSVEKRCYFYLVILALTLGLFQVMNSPSPVHSLGSGLITTAVVVVLTWLWRKKTQGLQYTMQELLPNKKQFKWVVGLLVLDYIALGLILNPEKLPGLMPQLTIWIIYAVLITLFIKSLKKSRILKEARPMKVPISFSWKVMIIFGLLFTAGTFLGTLLFPQLGIPISIIAMIFGILLGLRMLYLIIKDVIVKN